MTEMSRIERLVERARMEREQAHILAREILRADEEGREVKWPAERERRLARQLPVLTREEAYRRYNARLDAYEERRRARGARSGAKARGGDGRSRLTPKQLLERSGGLCYLCALPLALADVQIEHVIPIARGGLHVDENLAAACKDCNTRKSDRIVAFHVASRRPWYVT